MNPHLHRLIRDYQASVRMALQKPQASGIRMPTSAMDWAGMDLPLPGMLEDGIRYYKHGIGCAVWLPSRTVDFDFGEHGEADGFNRGRIAQFAMPNLAAYGFETPEAVKAAFDQPSHPARLSAGIDGLLPGGIRSGVRHGRLIAALLNAAACGPAAISQPRSGRQSIQDALILKQVLLRKQQKTTS